MTAAERVVVQLVADTDAKMHAIEEAAKDAGYILVTDGKVIQLALPHAIPLGFRQFAMKDKNAGRLAPREPRA